MRGEYNPCSQKTGLCRELPPRARRILVLTIWLTRLIGTTSACAENTRGTVFCQVDGGTTSACAENTPNSAIRKGSLGNYLRVRGEYLSATVPAEAFDELPPRARRILGPGRGRRRTLGTTSACAENTHRKGICGTLSRNYLRVRGEYRTATCPPHTDAGTTSACAENAFSKLVIDLKLRELPPRARRIPMACCKSSS